MPIDQESVGLLSKQGQYGTTQMSDVESPYDSYREGALMLEKTEEKSSGRVNMVRVIIAIIASAALIFLAIAASNTPQTSSLKSTNMIKSPENTAPTQTETCAPAPLSGFAEILQKIMGNVKLGKPVGGAMLADRGQLAEIKADKNYNFVEQYSQVVKNYDGYLNKCLNTVSIPDCTEDFPEIIDLKADGTIGGAAIVCIESCVEDRLFTFASATPTGIDYTTCIDPVETAFVYAPALIKSCIQEGYDCTEGGVNTCSDSECYNCISACVANEGFGPKGSSTNNVQMNAAFVQTHARVAPVDPAAAPVDPNAVPVVDPAAAPVDPATAATDQVPVVDPAAAPVDPATAATDQVPVVDPAAAPVDPATAATDQVPVVDPAAAPVDPATAATDQVPVVDPAAAPVDPAADTTTLGRLGAPVVGSDKGVVKGVVKVIDATTTRAAAVPA